MPRSDHLWDEHEAARYLGVSNYAIRKWKTQGKIGAIKLGHLVRYDPVEIKRFAESGREHPTCLSCKAEIPQIGILLPTEVDPEEPIYAAG